MKKFLKRVLLYGLVLWLCNLGVGYFLATYEKQDLFADGQFYPALRWEDYYQREEGIDVLVLGSSHAFRAFDPTVIGEEMELPGKVFNFGSAAQTPVTGYFILNEILTAHQPKFVIFDIYFMVFTSNNQIKNARYNWQFMQAGSPKRALFCEGFSLQEQTSLLFFPSYVYKQHLKGKLNKILGRRYLPPSKGTYQEAGFVSNPDTLSMDKLKNKNQFDVFEITTEAITERNLFYLKKIQERCKAENIPLIFTASPMPAITVEKISTYTNFYTLFKDLADQWQVPYYDYNVQRVEGLKDSDHYYDDDHLNAAGAQVFSRQVSRDVLSQQSK